MRSVLEVPAGGDAMKGYCPECEQLVTVIEAPKILLPDGRYRPRVEIVEHESPDGEGDVVRAVDGIVTHVYCDGSGMRI